MKKLLCVLLAVMFLTAFFAGCQNNSDNTSSTSSEGDAGQREAFTKPENYASVVQVTINPQFKLYLDASSTVLAVEPVNDDAKSIEPKITFENQKVEEVVGNIIVAANNGGFVKTDAKIDIKITEIVDKTVSATDVLEQIKTSADNKLTELEINAEITTSVETESDVSKENQDNSSTEDTSSEENPETSEPEASNCKHAKTSIKPVSTGKNIIDASKLDVINHATVCNACGEQLEFENHTVTNGKCNVCGQSNLAEKNVSIDHAGISGGASGHCAAEINADGTPDFDYMVQQGYYAIDYNALQQYLEDGYLKIPEAVFLAALRSKFVIDNNLFEKLKAQAEYELFWRTIWYSDGIFYFEYVGMGDMPEYGHKLIGYKDNKNGTVLVYYDYLKDYDVDESGITGAHLYYYAIEYTYNGTSNLSFINGQEYVGDYRIKGWIPVVDSLRIKSIKKVTDISGITPFK